MTRPRRNRLLLFLFWALTLAGVGALPPAGRLAALVLFGLASAGSFAVARDFFAGKRHLRKQRWVDALMAFAAFEKQLAAAPWKLRAAWLACGVYSLDPIAVSRNSAGVVHLENGKLELAAATFKSALERDAAYAVPHVNLAVVAAKRGDKAAVDTHLADAQRLGVTNKKTHARVRALLPA